MANPKDVAGMARFGIKPANPLGGISTPYLRKLAKTIGKNHALAYQLWDSTVHEARTLATMIENPTQVTEEQMERWVRDFDSWDICDQCCSNLFDKTQLAYQKALEWTKRPEEYVKRAGFVLMAVLAVHDKAADDDLFLEFLPIIKREADDDRNYVKKAVNWALRQIGKRSINLNASAVETAKALQQSESRSARWVASDALRELTSESVQQWLVKRGR